MEKNKNLQEELDALLNQLIRLSLTDANGVVSEGELWIRYKGKWEATEFKKLIQRLLQDERISEVKPGVYKPHEGVGS